MLSRLVVSLIVIALFVGGVWAWLTYGPSQWAVVARDQGKVIERSEPFETAEACQKALMQQDNYVNRLAPGATATCERSYWGLEKYLPL